MRCIHLQGDRIGLLAYAYDVVRLDEYLKDIGSVLTKVRENELGDIQEREDHSIVGHRRLRRRGRSETGQILCYGQRIDGEIERTPLINPCTDEESRKNTLIDDGRRGDVDGLVYGW